MFLDVCLTLNNESGDEKLAMDFLRDIFIGEDSLLTISSALPLAGIMSKEVAGESTPSQAKMCWNNIKPTRDAVFSELKQHLLPKFLVSIEFSMLKSDRVDDITKWRKRVAKRCAPPGMHSDIGIDLQTNPWLLNYFSFVETYSHQHPKSSGIHICRPCMTASFCFCHVFPF